MKGWRPLLPQTVLMGEFLGAPQRCPLLTPTDLWPHVYQLVAAPQAHKLKCHRYWRRPVRSPILHNIVNGHRSKHLNHTAPMMSYWKRDQLDICLHPKHWYDVFLFMIFMGVKLLLLLFWMTVITPNACFPKCHLVQGWFCGMHFVDSIHGSICMCNVFVEKINWFWHVLFFLKKIDSKAQKNSNDIISMLRENSNLGELKWRHSSMWNTLIFLTYFLYPHQKVPILLLLLNEHESLPSSWQYLCYLKLKYMYYPASWHDISQLFICTDILSNIMKATTIFWQNL